MAQGESFVYTACPGWGDHDYCALKTIVKDGKIVRTERVVYSDPEEPDGHICQKGCLAGRQPYDPNRLTTPLKRVGERGEGKWEEITWDQALDEIAAKLLELKDKYGPESVCMWLLPAGCPPAYGFEQYIPYRYANAFGMTNMMASIGLDNGPFYTEFYTVGTTANHVLTDPRIMSEYDTDLIYIWGCNPVENQLRVTKNLVIAREKGAKLVDIGLIFDGTAGFADEFVGVKPASDGHLAMAMIDYILQNNLQADAYLRQRTTAGYLVREDTGLMYKTADGYFAVWDTAADALSPVAPQHGAYQCELENIELFGEHEIDGVKCKTVLQLVKERAREWSAEKVAERVGISPEQIIKLADEFAHAPHAFIISGYGLRYANTNETYRLQHLLGLITGRQGTPGSGVIEGLQTQGYPLVFNDAGISMPVPGDPTSVKSKAVRMIDWFEEASAPNSPYKALIVAQGNPVHQQPNRQRWLDIVNQMELVVDYDVWLTDTGEIADYVLPDCMSFEREDLITGACYNHIMLQEPAIEPPAGCKEPVEFYTELAKRTGLGQYFDKTLAEWIDVRLDTKFPLIANIEPKVTYERLKKEKMIRAMVPAMPKWDPYLNPEEVMANKTGRIEIYAEALLEHDLAITKPIEPSDLGKHPEYPFQLFSGRQRFFMQSSFTDDPVNIELSGGTPATRLNPADAQELGLISGEMVEVYNDMGHVVTRLDIDESVPKGTVHVWFGWRRRQFEEGTYAEMVHPCPSRSGTGPVQDKWFNDWVKAGHSPNPFIEQMGTLIGSTDCYWDSYCNIRKYAGGEEA
ncbi:MAG: molybdopterin-containing oxidoreductase family protein [Coriobacteriales bacterium]|jgi:anaerobic selenocysteine-containing dehydrogenase